MGHLAGHFGRSIGKVKVYISAEKEVQASNY